MQKRVLVAFLFFQSMHFMGGETAQSTPAAASSAPVTYQEWKEVRQHSQQSGDVIVLKDGSQISGSFAILPPLYYSFGQMSFNVHEIDTVIFFMSGDSLKGQYITRTGQNFVASVKAESLPFIEKQEPARDVPKEIDPRLVRAIVFNALPGQVGEENMDLFSLELANGDQMPFFPESVLIHVIEAGKNKEISLADILEVTFNGGLHGSVFTGDFISPLRFGLVTDKYFFAYLTRKHHLVKLPWTQIAQIQGYNGGFKDRESNILTAKKNPREMDEETLATFETRDEMQIGSEMSRNLIGFAPEAFDVFEQPLDVQQKQKIYHRAGVQATIKPEEVPKKFVDTRTS